MSIKRFLSIFIIFVFLLSFLYCCADVDSITDDSGSIKIEDANGNIDEQGQEDKTIIGTDAELDCYKITYDLGEFKSIDGVSILKEIQEVEYGKSFDLIYPNISEEINYEFLKWIRKDTQEEISNGIYNFKENITLVALYKPIANKTWTKYYKQKS